MMSRYLSAKFKSVYATSVFKLKLMFGIETWGGAKKVSFNKVQNLQDQASKLAVPTNLREKNGRQRLDIINWLPIEKEILFATNCQTYKVLTCMPMNLKHLRIKTHMKLGTKPRWLGQNVATRKSYQNCAYIYNTLSKVAMTQLTLLKFKRELKKTLKTSTWLWISTRKIFWTLCVLYWLNVQFHTKVQYLSSHLSWTDRSWSQPSCTGRTTHPRWHGPTRTKCPPLMSVISKVIPTDISLGHCTQRWPNQTKRSNGPLTLELLQPNQIPVTFKLRDFH